MKGTLWHEKDGDFNPGWALIVWYALILGTALNIGAMVAAAVNPKAWPALGAAMIFDVCVIVAAAIGVYSLGRAKLIANSKVLASGTAAIGKAVSPPYPGMDYDERGDEGND